MSCAAILLLGLIEGVTEFLPVSSTGHLLLAERWLRLERQPSELFNVVIQSGAVLAVLLAFAGRLREMAQQWKSTAVREYICKLAVAFLVTAAGGVALKKLGLEKLPDRAGPVAWATLIGGVVILLVEASRRTAPPGASGISWFTAIAVGGAQLLAMAFPGTSRSGASIVVALICGIGRPAATEFSFLLGVPTILAASAFEIISALRHPGSAHESFGELVLGTIVAAATAFVAVKWLLHYVQNHTFVLFGWYRVVLGGVILIALVLANGSF